MNFVYMRTAGVFTHMHFNLIRLIPFLVLGLFLGFSNSWAQSEPTVPEPLPFSADHFRISVSGTLGAIDADPILLPGNLRDTDHLKLVGNRFPETAAQGANWIFFKNGYFLTFDSAGVPQAKGLMAGWTVAKSGANFLILGDGTLVTIDQFGFYYTKPELGVVNPKAVGGTFYVTSDDKIVTIASNGFYNDSYSFSRLELGAASPITLGGSYFIAEGKIFSVRTDGEIKNEWKAPLPKIRYRGGTYFFDQDSFLYRMNAQGQWKKEQLSPAIKPSVLGFRHFISQAGHLYTFDSTGEDAEESHWILMTDKTTETFRGLKIHEKK
jgi:hypothetical protein